MKKAILLTYLLFFLFSCGPDCPPCPDESRNLNIPTEYWEIFECAGSDYSDYVREHVHCAYFVDNLKHINTDYIGYADCDCNDIYIKIQKEYPISESIVMIHEVAHLEKQCSDNDEEYALKEQGEFWDSLVYGDTKCYLKYYNDDFTY